MSTRQRGLSVRARLTIGMAAIAATAFALVAFVAPGVVRNVLEDDLLVAEAETASVVAAFDDPAMFDPDDLIDLADENFFPIDSDVLFEVGGILTDVFGDFRPFDLTDEDPERMASEQVALLRSIDRLEFLTDAAGGPFILELDTSVGCPRRTRRFVRARRRREAGG